MYLSVLNNIDTIKKYLESFMYFLGIVHIVCLDIGLFDVHAKIVILFKMRRKKKWFRSLQSCTYIIIYTCEESPHLKEISKGKYQ